MNEMNPNHLNSDLSCDQARAHFALLVYGELSFDEEERLESHLDGCAECGAELERHKTLHQAFDAVSVEPPASLLRNCRADLAAALRHDPGPERGLGLPGRVGLADRFGVAGRSWWDRLVDFCTAGPILRPAGAVALLLAGFIGARLMPTLGESLIPGASQSGINRVSDVEAQNDGTVRVVVDETRQRTFTGGLDDQHIRNLLLEAVRDPNNPGLRIDSVDLLTRRAQSADIRGALVDRVLHDQNDGVRLKAMEGLKPFAADPEVHEALSHALFGDANPGVRTRAIDLLIQAPAGQMPANLDRATIGMLQQLMSQERNASVRQKSEKILELMNASAEIY